MINSEFAAGMRKLAASVSVISTRYEGKNYGLTASAITALSAEPPSLIACINQEAGAHAFIKKSGIFTVNILCKSQSHIATVFASEDTGARFETGTWVHSPKGAPRLKGAAASFECELMDALPGFTHDIFVGLITDITTSPADALLYADGEYGHFRLEGQS